MSGKILTPDQFARRFEQFRNRFELHLMEGSLLDHDAALRELVDELVDEVEHALQYGYETDDRKGAEELLTRARKCLR